MIITPLSKVDKMTNQATDAEFRAALKAANAIPAEVARILGCSRQAVTQRLARNPELQDYVQEIEASLLDASESLVVKAIGDEDLPTAKWVLERKGKQRGWANKLESEQRLSDADLQAIITSLGGDMDKLLALKAALES